MHESFKKELLKLSEETEGDNTFRQILNASLEKFFDIDRRKSKRAKRGSVSRAERKKLLSEYDYKCFYCHKKLNLDNSTTEHIKPRHKGGRAIIAPSCVECNFRHSKVVSQEWQKQNNKFIKFKNEILNERYAKNSKAQQIKNAIFLKILDYFIRFATLQYRYVLRQRKMEPITDEQMRILNKIMFDILRSRIFKIGLDIKYTDLIDDAELKEFLEEEFKNRLDFIDEEKNELIKHLNGDQS